MSERILNAGTKLHFGAPANPMPEVMADAISQVVAQVPGILEAHLPQCFIEGDTEARQMLVVGVSKRNEIPTIMNDLMPKLQFVFPAGQFIDILPFEHGAIPHGVRQASCQIFGKAKKPWWKLW
ncbi:MAG TPA: enhanced serine sensitivity protein SseB C-terminal domain-containing protein [Gammaproteobacteria bacterium]